MILQNKGIVKIEKKDESDLYLVKQGELEPFIKMMKKDGWELIDRSETANLLVFEKGNNSIGVGYKYYTRYHTIINSPRMNLRVLNFNKGLLRRSFFLVALT